MGADEKQPSTRKHKKGWWRHRPGGKSKFYRNQLPKDPPSKWYKEVSETNKDFPAKKYNPILDNRRKDSS